MTLRVEHLSVTYDDTTALADVSLEVADGETVAVLGPSGSGKSTLLRAVAGIQPVAEGLVLIDGVDLAGVPVHRRGFGVVFQSYALFEHLDVAGNVAFGLARRGAVDRDRVEAALDLVGLGGFGARSVDTLSGGERQRVAVARALVIEPPVLLLDEPLGAIDVALKDRLLGDLVRIVDDRTTLYVTHDHDEAMTIGDRVAVLRDGRLVAIDTPEALWSRPPDPWTARFLGHPNVYEDGSPFAEGAHLVPVGSVRVGDGVDATVVGGRFAGEHWTVVASVGHVEVTFRSERPLDVGSLVGLSVENVVGFP